MNFRNEFFDVICQSKRIWLPFFYVDVILLVLAVVGYVSAEPGSGAHVVSIVSLGMLVVPLVCMVSFLSICERRPG